MPELNPFDMDFDGDVDGIDFLGFDYLMRRVLRPDEEADGGWDDYVTRTGYYYDAFVTGHTIDLPTL